jgi:hypothetical protein
LEYNKNTQKEIVSTLRKVQSEIKEIAKEKLGNAEDLWDAISKYAQVVNALPSGLKNIFENSFEWEGIKVNSMAINRSYTYQDNLIITDYFKEVDADSTDGYKCRSQKVNRIFPHKNTEILFQDLKSNHGNSLRARTIFKENSSVERVVVINAIDKPAEDHLFDIDGMRFVKINKERFKYTSLVEKAKLQSKGRGASGESRAGVPLFELDLDLVNRHKYRNTDYWLNCTESIDDLELRASDPDGRKLIYLPISNYKIVGETKTGQEESVALNALLRDVDAIRGVQKSLHENNSEVEDEEEFEFPLVIGVRRKDCSKLNKSYWSSWANYKKSFCKQYLLDNMKEVEKSERAMAFKSDDVNMEDYRAIGSLLDNGKFRKLVENSLKDKGNILRSVVDDLALMTDTKGSSLDTICRMITFLKEHDADWVKENIPSSYNVNGFNDNCKKVAERYPLLVNFSIELYHWQSMTEHNLGKNLIDYILMCDLVGEGD